MPAKMRGEQNSRKDGACHVDAQMRVARAALHFWEEPCISGKEGSGAVFLQAVLLGGVFCQNTEIFRGQAGENVSVEQAGRDLSESTGAGSQ